MSDGSFYNKKRNTAVMTFIYGKVIFSYCACMKNAQNLTNTSRVPLDCDTVGGYRNITRRYKSKHLDLSLHHP